MPEHPSTLLAIKPLPYIEDRIPAELWPAFLDLIRTNLQHSGFEDPESCDELILFTYNHPFSAIAALNNCLSKVKETFSATTDEGNTPINIILHLVQRDDTGSQFRNADASIWEMLNPEGIYISRELKTNWDLLMDKRELPPVKLTNHNEGLSLVTFSSKFETTTDLLLSFRSLPVEEGNLRECFYCGMKSHNPGSCPSKFLNMEVDGLAEVGYVTFEALNKLYKQVFHEQGKFTNLMTAGVTQAQLKKDPALAVYVSFFDLKQLFQPRFLWNMTFSPYTKWEATFKSEKLQVDNKNLQLGLDCLRVRKYSQTEELLQSEVQHTKLKRFYATVGLAFLALERGRAADMGSLLESATNMATQEKERIYIALLQSRYFELTNELWKARDILKNILTIKPDCQAIRYRKIQLEANGNFNEGVFGLLRSLLTGQRQFFMTVLMDPTLIPVQEKVENILSSQYFALQHSSQNNLLLATNNVNELTLWFDEKDPQKTVYTKTLENLQKRLERKSYFDVLDVETQAKALLSSAKQLRENKLNKLYDSVERATVKWTGYYNFWKTYKYKRFFKKFRLKLIPQKKKLESVHELAKKNSGETYKEAKTTLYDILVDLKELEGIFNRMNSVSYLISCAFIFGKKLLITEFTVAGLGIFLSLGVSLVPADAVVSDFASLFIDPQFQKKIIIFTAIVISPIIALSWALMNITKKAES